MRVFSVIAVLVFAVGLILLAGCGRDNMGGGFGPLGGGGTITYEIEDRARGCTTGEHTFNSKAEMCQGLRSDGLNNGCAPEGRERFYLDSGCPPPFRRTP
jgi:hypothetical protein